MKEHLISYNLYTCIPNQALHFGQICLFKHEKLRGIYLRCRPDSSQLDLHINSSRKIKLHQGINCLGCWVKNVNESLVGTDLKMEPRILVDMGRFQNTVDPLFGW